MRRKLAALMLAMLLTLTLGAAVLWWLGISESGLRWILHQAAQASQGALAVHGARGTLLARCILPGCHLKARRCMLMCRICNSIGRRIDYGNNAWQY